MGVGLTMTFSVTRMINFAHAELVTLGAYAVVVGVNMYGWGIGPALTAAVLIGLLGAVLIDETIYKPLTARGAPDLYMMVASIGISMIARHLIYIFADVNGLLNVKARILTQPVMFIGYGTVTDVHLYAVPGALVLAALIGAGAGYFLSYPALRVREMYLAMVLLIVAEISRSYVRATHSVACGPHGLVGIPNHPPRRSVCTDCTRATAKYLSSTASPWPRSRGVLSSF